MIDIRKLKELVRLMVDNDLTELDLRDSEEQVTMRRSPPAGPYPHGLPGAMSVPYPMHAGPMGGGGASALQVPPPTVTSAPSSPVKDSAGGGADAGDEGLIRIESPMVGTFYSAATPDAPPFITAGAAVTPDKVVCIIEAMKIFNEIKAECAGTVQRVLVKNGEPVEFGQALYLVKPN